MGDLQQRHKGLTHANPVATNTLLASYHGCHRTYYIATTTTAGTAMIIVNDFGIALSIGSGCGFVPVELLLAETDVRLR